MYKWIEIQKPDDFEKLSDYLPSAQFALGEVRDLLALNLKSDVGGIVIEYPYVDKDYRSTFYHYYAKKGLTYSRHCARLHFIMAGWKFENSPFRFINAAGEECLDDINDGYFGFMVLRPTRTATIGRTVISPAAIKGVSGSLIEYAHKAHVAGNTARVKGFPYMQQPRDIAVCAHAACWAILRHYSERYALYSEVLLHNVSKLGKTFDPGGLLPSLGITWVDVERIFAAAGTYPLFVPRSADADSHDGFYTQLLAYLDSGFPLFGVQGGRNHAVAVTGYKAESSIQSQSTDRCVSLWDHVSSLLVVDDNHFPYRSIPRQTSATTKYAIDALDGFIVPLPEKMFLPAYSVIEWSNEIAESPVENFEELNTDERLVVRHFLTTTAAWHRHLRRTQSNLPAEFTDVAFQLGMPQFIWVVEYATNEQWANEQIKARLVLDATAPAHEFFPAFLLHDAKGALWIDRLNLSKQVYQPFATKCGPLARMDSNLSKY